jgi:Leucine-rich repeat (LRR) protein
MKVVEKFCGKRVAHYDVEHRSEIKFALENDDIQGLIVRKNNETTDESVEWLNQFKGLKILSLHGYSVSTDLSVLKEQGKLEQLVLDTNWKPPIIDFSWFPWLKSVSLSWRRGVFKNTQLNNLDELRIWKYSNKDLTELEGFPYIKHLQLVQAKCENLEGIEKLDNLENLDVYYMSKLTDISALALDSLRFLAIENSKKIMGYNSIGKCHNLEKLYIHDSAPIDSLAFVNQLKNIKSFRFINTDVLDGDMSPLLTVPDVCFTQKRHFSHKLTDFTSA